LDQDRETGEVSNKIDSCSSLKRSRILPDVVVSIARVSAGILITTRDRKTRVYAENDFIAIY